MKDQNLIRPPFFELGPKAYMYGKKFIDLSLFADELSNKYDVSIIVTPQYVDIPEIANKTKKIFVFAQHMDPISVGRGIGAVLPESLKSAGASGVLLNHVERRLTFDVLKKTMERAEEVGLMTMVCADDLKGCKLVAKLKPTIIIAESPNLIGGGKRDEKEAANIQRINQVVKAISPNTLVLHGAGINNPDDVYSVISSGALGTGSTSGVMLADDSFNMLEKMIISVNKAWNNQKKEE